MSAPPPPNAGAPGPRGGEAGLPPTAVGCMSMLLLLGGALWLWLRDRGHLVQERAIDEHGVLLEIGVGVAVGIGTSAVLVAGRRLVPLFRDLENALVDVLRPRERDALFLALASALSEEFFFRLAVLDALGLWWSAGLFAVLHLGPGVLRLQALFALGIGLAFGLLVQAGFGLLSVTLAHALINFLSLLRLSRVAAARKEP